MARSNLLCRGDMGGGGWKLPLLPSGGQFWSVYYSVLEVPEGTKSSCPNGYGLLMCTLLAPVPSLGYFCATSPCFLGSPPKSTVCTQIFVSGSAFPGTHTSTEGNPEIERDLRDTSAYHSLCLELPGPYLDPDSNTFKSPENKTKEKAKPQQCHEWHIWDKQKSEHQVGHLKILRNYC